MQNALSIRLSLLRSFVSCTEIIMPASLRRTCNDNKKSSNDEVQTKKQKLEDGNVENGSGDVEGNINSKTGDGRKFNLKIVSWNVAGLRALIKKDGHKWMENYDADIICLQETKCNEKEFPEELKQLKQYKYYLNEAKIKKGFSGVALLSKTAPIKVDFGINIAEHDQEGRTITAEYEDFYLVTTYVPNSQRGLKRLKYRMQWNDDFMAYLKNLDTKKPLILSGDLNVSHLEIDLANPKSNKKSAGFTQEERDGMTSLISSGFTDTFRHFYPDLEKKYTFWTYMGNARGKNVGWRLDYFLVSDRWLENICDNIIEKKVMGSDHCPISLLVALPDKK